MEQALVRINDLFQVQRRLADMHERRILVKALKERLRFCLRKGTFGISGNKNSAREIASHRNEVEIFIESGRSLLQFLPDLPHMLMPQRLVNGNIVIPP